MKPATLLESNTFHKDYKIVADNSYYYVKVLSSDNSYFIAPVFRRPSKTDELIIESVGDSYIVKHLIPEAEKAKEQKIGSIKIEENVVTFSIDFNGRTISTSFKVK